VTFTLIIEKDEQLLLSSFNNVMLEMCCVKALKDIAGFFCRIPLFSFSKAKWKVGIDKLRHISFYL